ncbi:hypothetical protein LguiB_032936 [Lonicera macranthoides]
MKILNIIKGMARLSTLEAEKIKKISGISTVFEDTTDSFYFSNTTTVGSKRAPVVTTFSARGPNPMVPGVHKPDVIVPGFNILCAFPLNVPLTSSFERPTNRSFEPFPSAINTPPPLPPSHLETKVSTNSLKWSVWIIPVLECEGKVV